MQVARQDEKKQKMRIVVCGSMSHYFKMLAVKKKLISLGHEVVLPEVATSQQLKDIKNNSYIDTAELKIRHDFIRKHYQHIVKSDAVLIVNHDKNGIKNYIGGNAFLEMGFAYVSNKPIFLLNPIPNIRFYYHEIRAMQPIVIQDNWSKLNLKNLPD